MRANHPNVRGTSGLASAETMSEWVKPSKIYAEKDAPMPFSSHIASS